MRDLQISLLHRIHVDLLHQQKMVGEIKWLSEKMDKNTASVSRWRTDEMQPAVETFYEIAKLLR